MNRKQADKIIAVIEKGATGRGNYFPTEDTECVTGNLWLAAGGERTWHALRTGLFDILEKEYHIDSGKFALLYRENDAHKDVAERRTALIDLVNSWVT